MTKAYRHHNSAECAELLERAYQGALTDDDKNIIKEIFSKKETAKDYYNERNRKFRESEQYEKYIKSLPGFIQTMNIFSLENDTIVFSNPNAGVDSDREIAKKYLTVGNTYTVDYTVVESEFTDVYIKEVPGIPFNSVLFT